MSALDNGYSRGWDYEAMKQLMAKANDPHARELTTAQKIYSRFVKWTQKWTT
jgi:hypothetical protein